MSSWLLNFWYQNKHPLSYLLYPLHLLLYVLIRSRKFLYQKNILSSHKVNVPVIIVGNITVGGTGKSPVVIHLAKQLSVAGYKIGILSRGYGGKSSNYPLQVNRQSLVSEVGDEPLMIKQRTDAVVAVDPLRSRGAKYLVEQHQCTLIICDDGLQHYALQRDIEILIVDGERNFGNGLLMPFGPLREPVGRAKQVDAIVFNGAVLNGSVTKLSIETAKQFLMQFESVHFVAVKDSNKTMEIADFLTEYGTDKEILHAVAGIGNPQRFFDHLQDLGLAIKPYKFNDHHRYSTNDFSNMEGVIIMTEKDAVKCREFATNNMWYLKVDAKISPSISQYCLDLLTGVH